MSPHVLARFFLIACLLLSAASVRAGAGAREGIFLSQQERTLFAYALLANGASPAQKAKILTRAKTYFQTVYAQPIRTVVVGSFDEYTRELRGEWPDTQSVELDLKIVERTPPRPPTRFVSNNPQVQQLIDAHEARVFEATKNAAFSANLAFVGRHLMAHAKSPAPLDINAVFSTVLEDVDRLVAEQFSELERIGDKMSRVAFGAGNNEPMALALQTLFSGYYGRLSPTSKKLIINAFLGGDLRADDVTKLETMIQTSGPQFQKLVQAFANQRIPPKLRAVFRRLERSVRVVPFHQVAEILKRNSDSYKLVRVDEKPLGTGTMAQTHHAILQDADSREHEVAVRFLKPGIHDRVIEDRAILVELAKIIDGLPAYAASGGPKMSPLVNQISSTVSAEGDQELTMKNQEDASVYRRTVPFRTPEYKTSIKFLVPHVYRAQNGRASELMVQEFLPGKPLEKASAEFREAIPLLDRGIAEAAARLWTHEVLFGSGFFHSDLHPGNYSVNVAEPEIKVPLMDYGMTGRLSKAQQEQLIVLTASIELGDSEKSARALWTLIGDGRPSENFEEVRRFARDLQARIDRRALPRQALQQWLSRASDAGLGLTETLVNLNRGAFIIDHMLEESGSEMRLSDIGLELSRSRVVTVARILSDKGGFTMKQIAQLGLNDVKARLGHTGAVGVRCEGVFLP